MYEFVITMLIIATENDDELADRYYAHAVKNSNKKIISYKSHYKILKFKPFSKKSDNIIKKQMAQLDLKYGKEFLENEYGWADNLFPGKQKANLRLLEEKVEMSRFRPYYLMCTEHIHSNFNGFKNFIIRNKIILPMLLEHETEFEAFIDPMQFTISILHEVSDYILYEFSVEHEYKINIQFLTKIFQAMVDHFKAHQSKK